MDPNPTSFPILSYVLSRLPSTITSKLSNPKPGPTIPDLELGITPQSPSATSSTPPFDLADHMPGLRDPALLSAMSRAVADVSRTRSALTELGPRPDHEAVDSAESLLSAAATTDPTNLEGLKSVVKLDEMHEAYENLLAEAEKRLEAIYRKAMEETAGGGGVVVEKNTEKSEGVKGKEEEILVDEEVVRVLKEAEEGRSVKRVDLKDRQLKILPEAIAVVRGLVYLNLDHNQLELIPDAIGGLNSLEELHLASNILVALPDSIGLLSNLKILHVSGNKLRALPDSISKCRSLIELDASYNALSYLPTNIGYELVNLQKLWVYLNKLRSLPTSVCEMISLRLLDAHFNELRGLPSDIGKLTNLETLNLSSNFSDMTELPFSFGDLMNLRELDLSNNQIHALPDTFGRLDKLEKLNLDQNPLVMPPMEIVNQGVEAVKEYMAQRWLDILLKEEEKAQAAAAAAAAATAAAESPQASSPTAWLARSVSSLGTWVSDVSGSLAGYIGGREKSERDAYLDQQL